MLSDDVSENSEKIHVVADNITSNSEKIHRVAGHVANISDHIIHNSDTINFVANNLTEKIHNVANHVTNISDHVDHNYVKINLIADHVDNATRCTAINWDLNCCTFANPCGIGRGHCDSDDECYGDLKCGSDNCIGFGDSGADCCMLVGIHDNALNIANNVADIENFKVSSVLNSKYLFFES